MSPRRLEALRAVARQDVSPRERDIARAVLQAAGAGWGGPPRRPAPPAAPAPMPFGWSVSSANGSSTINIVWLTEA